MNNNKQTPVAGYFYTYVKNGKVEKILINIELKDLLLKRFGKDLSNVDEDELIKFIEEHKQ